MRGQCLLWSTPTGCDNLGSHKRVGPKLTTTPFGLGALAVGILRMLIGRAWVEWELFWLGSGSDGSGGWRPEQTGKWPPSQKPGTLEAGTERSTRTGIVQRQSWSWYSGRIPDDRLTMAPMSVQNSFQNPEVIWTPRLETTSVGRQWSLKMWTRTSLAVSLAVESLGRGTKWAILLNWSPTMVVCPTDSGRQVVEDVRPNMMGHKQRL